MNLSLAAELDAAQARAACHASGPAIVLAGPGSGKTRCIVYRVVRLLESGVPPAKILCLTFSVNAATEMRQRISKLTGIPQQRLENTISTFHSQALRLLLREREALGFELEPNPVLTPPKVAYALRGLFPGQEVKELRREFGRLRRNLVTPDARHPEYDAWDEWLRDNGVIDFDSMVFLAVELLQAHPEVRMEWQRFEHVIVDEGHDTSPDQERFARLLSARTGNLFLVQDPSQRIYGWRGATGFKVNGDGAVYHLAANYRSTAEIVDTFRPYADEDALELAEQMRAVRADAGSVRQLGFGTEEEQAAAAANEIQSTGEKDSAVLARTRALLVPVADALEERGIRYVWNGKNFWSQREVKEVLAFARLALDPNDRESLRVALTSSARCARFLGRKFADEVLAQGGLAAEPDGDRRKLAQWASFKLAVEWIGRCKDSSPSVFIRLILSEAGFDNGEADEEPDNFRQENLETLVRRAARFQTIQGLLDHARKMEHAKKRAGVVLSTIHSAKGLEWADVYVIGVSEDLLPHKRAEDWREERRCLYVALSRAKTNLWISWHGKPSSFLGISKEGK